MVELDPIHYRLDRACVCDNLDICWLGPACLSYRTRSWSNGLGLPSNHITITGCDEVKFKVAEEGPGFGIQGAEYGDARVLHGFKHFRPRRCGFYLCPQPQRDSEFSAVVDNPAVR